MADHFVFEERAQGWSRKRGKKKKGTGREASFPYVSNSFPFSKSSMRPPATDWRKGEKKGNAGRGQPCFPSILFTILPSTGNPERLRRVEGRGEKEKEKKEKICTKDEFTFSCEVY